MLWSPSVLAGVATGNQSGEVKALLLASLLLIGWAGWMWRAWLKGPETMEEVDRQQALAQKSAMRASGRLSVSDGFWRRAERKMFGVMRLGEAKRLKVHTQSEGSGR
jgi:hypothetical protein